MKTFDYSALAPSYLSILKLLTWIWSAFVMVPVFVLAYFAAENLWYHAAIKAVSCWVLFGVLINAYVKAWYKRYQYALTEQGLVIHRGVFWRQMIVIPRNRIQHTDITTGPLERRKSLAKLIVHTAGTRDAHVTLHGLLESRAAELRKELIVATQDDTV